MAHRLRRRAPAAENTGRGAGPGPPLAGVAPGPVGTALLMASATQPAPTAGKTVAQAGEVRVARVESLRAIAALGVVIGHIWLLGRIASHLGYQDTFAQRFVLSGGFGLSLFFGLSGYLIYWPF